MKKALKTFFVALLVLAVSVACVACTGDGQTVTAKGLKIKKIDGVYTIYDYVDEGNGVTELDIGAILAEKNITEKYNIKSGAFADNDTLTKIIVSNKVNEVGAGAFRNMKALQSLEVPFVGKTVNADAFPYETAAAADKSVDRERTLAHYFGTESYEQSTKILINYGSSNLACYVPMTFKEVVVNATVTVEGKDFYSIPMHAFDGATNLTSIVLKGDKLGAIGQNAFNGCVNVKNIVIPSTVTTIYENAFSNCTKLETVITSSNLEIKDNAFNGCAKLKYFGEQVASIPNYVIDFNNVVNAGAGSFDLGNQTYTVINATGFDLESIFGQTKIAE
jgi:hypothetical protein